MYHIGKMSPMILSVMHDLLHHIPSTCKICIVCHLDTGSYRFVLDILYYHLYLLLTRAHAIFRYPLPSLDIKALSKKYKPVYGVVFSQFNLKWHVLRAN